MTKPKFPPNYCDWAFDNNGADYCGLGMALREQLAYRAKDADEIERLREVLWACHHAGGPARAIADAALASPAQKEGEASDDSRSVGR